MFKSYLLFLLCFKFVYGLKKEYCAFHDEVCLTEGIRQHVYPMFVAGLPGVERTDPMSLEEIIADLPDSVYNLHQATVTGFKSCQFQKLKLTQDELNKTAFDYSVLCPHLTLRSNYKLKNSKGACPHDETGNCEIVYNDYLITLKGKFAITTDEYYKAHISITDCHPILDLQTGTTCKYISDIVDDRKLDNDYNKIEELSRQTVMGTVVKKYIQNLKDFLLAIPVEDLHYRYV